MIPALGAIGAACLTLATPAGAQTAPAISAYPLPGTQTAATGSQISLRGAPLARLGAIEVVGSRSGRHAGRLRAHSDGRGASYLLATPLTPGERVTVRTGLSIAGATDGDYTFTVARRPPPARTRPAEHPSVGNGAVRRFASRPDFAAPAVTVTTNDPSHAPGLVFLAPKGGRGQDGPMIVDDAGNIVWFKPIADRLEATDFRVQHYRGRPVLTWWQGRLIGGEGRGAGVIYDQRYRPLATVRAGNGYDADLHELQLTPQGTALIGVYDAVRRDLSPVGGRRDGIVVEGVVQEIDIKTGLVLFEWHSLGNVHLAESVEPVPKGRAQWDYLHLNSIAQDVDGDLVISARHTSSVIKLDRATGAIEWRLGGKASSFALAPGAGFELQHDARPLPDGTLTIYDNGRRGVSTDSRAITLRLDSTGHTATLVGALAHPGGLLSATQGSVQRLDGGGTFVGFGSRRWFTEYDASGRVVFDGQLAPGNDTYRAYRLPWSATPAGPPKIVARRGRDGAVTAYASFNGATGVARWELFAGPRSTGLRPVASAASAGFETAITVKAGRYVAMRAYDATGAVLGTSSTIRVASPSD